MATGRTFGVTILMATILLGGLTISSPADARRRRRVRKKAKKRPLGYAEAKKLFLEGVQLFDRRDYPRAIAKFKASLKHFHNPKVYARIALCHKWLGNNLKALVNYERFLSEFTATPKRRKDRKIRKDVELEVSRLLKLVAHLKVWAAGPVGAEVRLDGRVLGKAPLTRAIRLNPGPANVTVTAKGYYAFRRDLKLIADQTVVVQATLIKIKIKVIRKVVHIRATPIYKRWWFWTTLGVLLAGGATGLAVGLTSKPQTRDLTGLPIHPNTLARW